MTQTVIGMFDNAAEAQQAVQQLVSRGFSRDNIDVSNNTSGASESSTDTEEEGGGIGHFFRSLFSDDESDKYTNVAKRSQSIVTVHAQSADQAEDAADILDDCGAVNVDERAASYGFSASAGSYSNTNTASTDETTTKIPIIEENLEVGKREVLTGGTRVRSRIIERPVEESLRLREENVRVQRTPVNRAATSADLANFGEKQIEMTETAEVPVASKEARVVEEVSIGKEVSERTETISDTVRKTEVDVEDLDTTTNLNRTGSVNNSSGTL